MAITTIELIISVAAIWRVTHLLAEEDGPLDLIFIVRQKLGHGFFGNLLDCFYCLSMWVAIPFALYLTTDILSFLILWFALSGGCCIIQKLLTKNHNHELLRK